MKSSWWHYVCRTCSFNLFSYFFEGTVLKTWQTKLNVCKFSLKHGTKCSNDVDWGHISKLEQWCSLRGQALRTKNHVLGLTIGLEGSGLEGLGLQGSWPWLQARTFYFLGCFVSMRFTNFSKFCSSMQCTVEPFYFLTIHYLYIYGVSQYYSSIRWCTTEVTP